MKIKSVKENISIFGSEVHNDAQNKLEDKNEEMRTFFRTEEQIFTGQTSQTEFIFSFSLKDKPMCRWCHGNMFCMRRACLCFASQTGGD